MECCVSPMASLSHTSTQYCIQPNHQYSTFDTSMVCFLYLCAVKLIYVSSVHSVKCSFSQSPPCSFVHYKHNCCNCLHKTHTHLNETGKKTTCSARWLENHLAQMCGRLFRACVCVHFLCSATPVSVSNSGRAVLQHSLFPFHVIEFWVDLSTISVAFHLPLQIN